MNPNYLLKIESILLSPLAFQLKTKVENIFLETPRLRCSSYHFQVQTGRSVKGLNHVLTQVLAAATESA